MDLLNMDFHDVKIYHEVINPLSMEKVLSFYRVFRLLTLQCVDSHQNLHRIHGIFQWNSLTLS